MIHSRTIFFAEPETGSRRRGSAAASPRGVRFSAAPRVISPEATCSRLLAGAGFLPRGLRWSSAGDAFVVASQPPCASPAVFSVPVLDACPSPESVASYPLARNRPTTGER